MCRSLFFNKGDLQLYLKRGSYTGAFLWILRIFLEHFFYRKPPVAASVYLGTSQTSTIIKFFSPKIVKP